MSHICLVLMHKSFKTKIIMANVSNCIWAWNLTDIPFYTKAIKLLQVHHILLIPHDVLHLEDWSFRISCPHWHPNVTIFLHLLQFTLCNMCDRTTIFLHIIPRIIHFCHQITSDLLQHGDDWLPSYHHYSSIKLFLHVVGQT